MKITATIDITPEEVRSMLGMPEYTWLQETIRLDQEKGTQYNPWSEAFEWNKKFNPLFALGSGSAQGVQQNE